MEWCSGMLNEDSGSVRITIEPVGDRADGSFVIVREIS
jgi:hypothetical protein